MINYDKIKYEIVTIVATFNSSKFLRETLDSLIKQDFKGNHLIFISDDSSIDNTKEIIQEYSVNYSNINYRINSVNLGLNKNVYTAIDLFNTKYVYLIAGDDYLLDSSFLTKQYEIMNNNLELSISYFDGYRFFHGNSDEKFDHLSFKPKQNPFDIDYWTKNSFFTINNQSIFFRKSYLPKFEKWMYDSFPEDFLLLFLLLLNGKCSFTNQKATMYRQHSNNVSLQFNTVNKIKSGINLINNINKYTNFKYKKYTGNNAWRYERLIFACFYEKKYLIMIKYFFIFIFMRNSLKNRIIFFKTLYKVVFKNYMVSY